MREMDREREGERERRLSESSWLAKDQSWLPGQTDAVTVPVGITL